MTRRIQPIPPQMQTRIVATMATRRSPVRRNASAQTTRARAPANSALVAKYTGMSGSPDAAEVIAPWKSANQW